MVDFLVAIGRNIALLFSLTFVYSLLWPQLKFRQSPLYRPFIGILFGCMGIFVMLTPIPLAPGVFTDGRDIIILLAGLLGGPIAALIAGIPIIIARYVIGGTGTLPGMGIGATAIMAAFVAWRSLNAPISRAKLQFLAAWGLVLTLIGRLWVLTLPNKQLALTLIVNTSLQLALLSVVETVLLGYLLAREVRREETQTALAESEDRFSKVFRASPLPIAVSSLEDGKVIDANDSFMKLINFSRSEVIGRSAAQLNTWVFPQQRKTIIEQINSEHTFQQGDIDIRSKDGQIHRCLLTADKIVLGGTPALLSLMLDMTERQQVEQSRAALALAVEKASFLTDFLATMSHDIKTPLSVINMSLFLLERLEDPQRQQESIESIREQTKILQHFIQDILTVSRLDYQAHLDQEDTDLSHMLTEIIGQLSPKAIGKRIQLLLDMAQDVPAVSADYDQLQRAFTNLIDNALNYTPESGRVEVRLRAESNRVVVAVADTGIGIKEQDLPHVFDLFYRSVEAQHFDKTGTGLGLAITKKILDLHEGTIEVTSTPGTGTTFRVELPCGQSVAA